MKTLFGWSNKKEKEKKVIHSIIKILFRLNVCFYNSTKFHIQTNIPTYLLTRTNKTKKVYKTKKINAKY